MKRRSRRRLPPAAASSEVVRVNAAPLPAGPPAGPPAVPGALEQAWERRKRQALEVVDLGIDLGRPLGMEPDEYRARMVAAKLVLGVNKSALPLPKFGELEAKDGQRAIQIRWADGRPVHMPLWGRGHQDDGDAE